MARRKGRILAFQALYSWDVGREPIDTILAFSWVPPENLERLGESGLLFTKLLVAGTIEHIAEIDALIRAYVSAWDFDRISKVDLALLRISVYSLLYQKETHPSIVIDEAVEIAKDFGQDDSYRFINAVLDNIRKATDKNSI